MANNAFVSSTGEVEEQLASAWSTLECPTGYVVIRVLNQGRTRQ